MDDVALALRWTEARLSVNDPGKYPQYCEMLRREWVRLRLLQMDAPRSELMRLPTDLESMAACLLSERDHVTWEHALWKLRAGSPAAGLDAIWRMAQAALDHGGYLEELRRDRAEGLMFWLGAEALAE
jgi:hypothetical protein